MANIYNSLKNVFQDLKKENSTNTAFVPIILVLLSIPLAYALNSIALGILIIAIAVSYKKEQFAFQKNLIYPLALYLLMALSFIWSIDKDSTLKALSKELALLIIPLAFLFMKNFTAEQKQKIIRFYSYGIFLFVIFYYLKAIVRFAITGDTGVFFYHELVTKDVNAIHVSIYLAIAFFYFLRQTSKSIIEYIALPSIFAMIFLLSSKNIIVVFVMLLVIYTIFYVKVSKRMRLRNLAVFIAILISVAFLGKIRERFMIEYESNMSDSTVNDVISKGNEKVYNVSIRQAWTQEKFQPNDFFPGTAFRVYQFRIFKELLIEENVFFTGFGLNASYPKIEEKAIQYDIFMGDEANQYEGYQSKNFHNQYVQNFAELGVFGFLLLMVMLLINLRNAIKSKDFVHFAFAILMISLFLTESFLWRQRGVVFFTVLYCLFNSKNLIKAQDTNI